MIEKIILDYMNTALASDNIQAFMEEPVNAPDKYIIIEKTGSSRNDMITSAVIAIRSHAKTMYEAALLNEKVKGLMLNSITNSNISKCELNSDYNFTDVTKKEYRYQAVFDLVYFN